MSRPTLFATAIALSLLAMPVLAQEAGGVSLAPELFNTNENVQRLALQQALAKLQLGALAAQPARRPAVTGQDPGQASGDAPPDRRGLAQAQIAKIRGDGGFLDGFSLGRPLAGSRIKPQSADPTQSVVVNNTFDSGVIIGNSNIVQQQFAGTPAGSLTRAQTVTGLPTSAQGKAATGPGGNATTNGGGNNAVAAGTNSTAQQQVVTIVR
jgi:hypothetical protein